MLEIITHEGTPEEKKEEKVISLSNAVLIVATSGKGDEAQGSLAVRRAQQAANRAFSSRLLNVRAEDCSRRPKGERRGRRFRRFQYSRVAETRRLRTLGERLPTVLISTRNEMFSARRMAMKFDEWLTAIPIQKTPHGARLDLRIYIYPDGHGNFCAEDEHGRSVANPQPVNNPCRKAREAIEKIWNWRFTVA